MLTTSLLAFDATLPDRDEFLDPARAVERLARLAPRTVGHRIEPVGLVRSKYRIGESLRVVHRVLVDGAERLVTARVFADRSDAVRAYDRSARMNHDGALHDADAGAVWWWFPNDRKLRDADRVVQADRELAAALGLDGWSASRVVEYAPERSLTVRAENSGGDALAFVKGYAPRSVDVERLLAHYAIADGGCADLGIRTPRVLGATDSAMALEAMPGRHWDRLPPAERGAAMRRLGAAIAWFHQRDIDAAPIADFGRLRPDRVAHSAALVARARPELAEPMHRLAERLDATRPASEPSVLLHGDCHPKNSLFDDGAVALIDLDQAGSGPAAADLGSLLARLRHGVLLGEHSPSLASELEASFLDGYRSIAELPDPASLRWHVAATLVAERAIRAVNRVHVGALASLPDLVDLALRDVEASRGR